MQRVIAVALFCAFIHPISAQSTSLLEQLQQQSLTEIVRQAMQQGDARRGALLFHQPHMQCATCHAVDESTSALGPNLAQWEKRVSPDYLIESVLSPSKSIREGYDTVIVTTNDGKQLIGILQDKSSDQIRLLEANRSGKPTTISKNDLEEIQRSTQSIMPEGLVNQLANKDQFYDLARYLIDIAEEGPEFAMSIQPPATLTALPPLPEYESHIDHAGMIADLDDESLKRGRKIYNRVCANCHGTLNREGSLPTAPKFASSPLKNGHDPFRLYQTLTHGHGLMVAQRWMVPQQKYDVIHYLREAFFRKHNSKLFTNANDDYLASLPKGDQRGPKPVKVEPYITMDYGPSLNHTYEITLNNSGDQIGRDLGRSPKAVDPWANPDKYWKPGEAPNYAYKGIAVRLDSGPGGITRGSQWMVYDHDTMNVQAGWSGNSFIDYCCIQFDGRHAVHNRLTGDIQFENPVGPGWAKPGTRDFTDPRPLGRDGRPYGPLPRDWVKYKGLFHHGLKTLLFYTVGDTIIIELPTMANAGSPIFVRQFNVAASEETLYLRLAPERAHAKVVGEAAEVSTLDGFVTLSIPPHSSTIEFSVAISRDPIDNADLPAVPGDLSRFTQGGPPRWVEPVVTEIKTVHKDKFQVDRFPLPRNNPWNAQVRTTGHDFFADNNRMAVCTWDGDVWVVDGIAQDHGKLNWRRIASGMFQPLGLKIVRDEIYVTCRDQLVLLRDLNQDGETDFYECFNNDHQVTEHFHEFAMGLQSDEQGNFYYAKSARHAKRAVVPHHGTLLKVSPDGESTEIVATGFRAANGVCLNPDGTFFVTDQEGHWNPKNRVNHVSPGGFYGNLYGYTDSRDASDDAMSQPLVWITNDYDRSPAELLWVPKDKWGPLGGSLLNLSYGYGRVYVVPHEVINGQMQGGVSRFPIPDFPSGLVRGRFHPSRDELYVCGMFSWAGSQQEPGCFHRIAYVDEPVHLPLTLKARKSTVEFSFSDPIDRESAENPEHYSVESWDLKRTPNYGSKHYNEQELDITDAKLSDDGRTVKLTIPDLAPTWGMEISYELKGKNGRAFEGEIHNSIYHLP